MIKHSIYIGWDPREAEAFSVAHHSLLRRMSQPIPVHKLALEDLMQRNLYTRPTERSNNRLIDKFSTREDYDGSISTEHAIARFLVPHLAGTGWALFMDGDVMVRGDIAEIFLNLDPNRAVYCVKHNHIPSNAVKMDGQVQTQYLCKNWSSVMIFNCDHPANQEYLTLPVINSWPGRDLHAFLWLLDRSAIGELSQEWNYLVGYTEHCPDPKLVHFTEGLPNMPGYEDCEYADDWREELARTRMSARRPRVSRT